MTGKERRSQIINQLQCSDHALSGTTLANSFKVSRQVIVQDIALLRSSGHEIIATNRGYLLSQSHGSRVSRIFKCCHSDEETEHELNLIVDQGGTIQNVSINHKLYGHIEAPLNIRCRRDVKEFLDGIQSGKSSLLKNVTSDYHYHTVLADSETVLDRIEEELLRAGYLIVKKNEA